MPTWIPVTSQQHRHAAWTKFNNYAHASNDAVVPLLVSELTKALPHYALAFVPSADCYQLVAVQGLQTGRNLYLNQQQQWLVPYVPAHYRSFPFTLLANREQPDQAMLCVDGDSGLFIADSRDTTNPELTLLYTPEGQYTKPAQDVIEFLRQSHHIRLLTQKLVDQLHQHQLIQPWPIQVQVQTTADPSDGHPKTVQGLFRIDEAALRQLAPQALSQLVQSGALALAYGQILSQSRLEQLSKLEHYHHSSTQPSPALTGLDFDALFGANDDLIMF
jgi:hypothetical protein